MATLPKNKYYNLFLSLIYYIIYFSNSIHLWFCRQSASIFESYILPYFFKIPFELLSYIQRVQKVTFWSFCSKTFIFGIVSVCSLCSCSTQLVNRFIWNLVSSPNYEEFFFFLFCRELKICVDCLKTNAQNYDFKPTIRKCSLYGSKNHAIFHKIKFYNIGKKKFLIRAVIKDRISQNLLCRFRSSSGKMWSLEILSSIAKS